MLRKRTYKILCVSFIGVVAIGVLVFKGLLFTSHVSAAGVEVLSDNPAPVPGDVLGYAWGATTDAPYGGVGWINFNCKSAPDPDPSGTINACNGAAGAWGVKMNLSHTINQGQLSGYAWSDNLGWLSFNAADTARCFSDSLRVNPMTATVVDLDNPTAGLVIKGWARFVSPDQAGGNSGGWDGCVSFHDKAPNLARNLYKTSVAYPSGDLSGFAWGSNVVGWISFDCNGCDTRVVIDQSAANINFWADDTYVPPGGSTHLHWQATSNVSVCSDYRNSSGYNDWKIVIDTGGIGGIGGGGGSQPAAISVLAGNLPTPQSPWLISGINQTTTYQISCTDNLGNDLPTKYVTVNVGILGCTDSTASNYNPSATVDDGSCIIVPPTSPYIDLTVSNPTLIIGSGNYAETLKWTSNVSTLHACTGSFFRFNSLGQSTSPQVTGWTNIALPNPDQNNYMAVQNASGAGSFAALAAGVSSPFIHFQFNIACHDSANGDNIVYDTATVFMQSGICTDPLADNPGGPLPCTYNNNPGGGSVNLNLNAAPSVLTVGSGNYNVDLDWNTNNTAAFSGACTGTAKFNNTTITVPNWSVSNLPLPNNARTVNLTSWAAGASTSDQFKFTINCTSTDGPETAQATVNFQAASFEMPLIDLWIMQPDVTPPVGDLYHETISNTVGYPAVKLRWQALNTSQCRADSYMYDNATGSNMIGHNVDWDNTNKPVDEIDQANNVQFLDISNNNLSVLHPTIFKISCIPDDPALACDITGADPTKPCPGSSVCLGLTNVPFPACSVTGTGTRPPGYKEI
jgi:hypothetical protein